MLSNTITARPRPAAQLRRSTSTLAQGASPPPPYASSLAFNRKPGVVPFPNYLGSPLPATLQMVGLGNSQPASPHETEQDSNNDWLNEKSREELTELLLKADGLIKERETELGVTSAACKSLYDSNVSLKNQHQALVARIPSTAHDSPSPSPISLSDALETLSASSDASTSSDVDSSPFSYFKRARRISIHPSDISALADQNAELLQKLETLETEALNTDRSGRRALKQLEKEIQQLRDELEDTQARSEQLEKQAQMGTEKIVEELLKKKKEQEAKVRAMRNNSTPGDAWPFSDETDIRDFAPSGAFSKAYLTPSQSVEFPSSSSHQQFGVPSYGPEHAFEHHNQHTLVSQLLAKIKELEETNAQIIEQQSETADKLEAVQRETESISKVYEYFSPENGIEWEVVAEDGRKSAEGTIRFRSFRRTLESQSDDVPSLLLPQKAPRRKSVLDLFNLDERQGANRTSTPCPDTSSYSRGDLSPLRLDTSEYGGSLYVGSHQTLQAELGSDFNNDAFDPLLRRQGSLYDLSFSVSPSPTPGNRSPLHSIADSVAWRNHSTPVHNALRLSVEPPTPHTGNASGSMRENTKDRHERMAQTLSLRTDRWVDGRLSTRSSFVNDSTSTRNSASLPRRLSTAPDSDDGSTTPLGPLLANETPVVLDDRGQKRRVLVAFVLELWLWLQFALVIVVFLWAMAKRGPRSVLSEGDRRAVARGR
ncbi:hypothetical protein GGX14DRAFT_611979 [Mycena pura]|uniref:Uncharacterized protein n=1 Tax=Mycena pura TaxID=153505 RepID=A0AAD6YSA9_9AGAR|nr:hypothetical protein GGX14DRAFT_611979 [Mycena pura]